MPLVLTIREDEAIRIGEAVIRVLRDPNGGSRQFRVSIQAPKDVAITRMGKVNDINDETLMKERNNERKDPCPNNDR